MKYGIPVTALLLALVALVVTLVRGTHPPDEFQVRAGSPDPRASSLAGRVESLEGEVAALRGELVRLRANPPRTLASRELVDPSDSPATQEQPSARLDALEARLAQVEQGTRGEHASDRDSRALVQAKDLDTERRANDVVSWTSVARDSGASEGDRLRALGGLRNSRDAAGNDARLAVLPEMIQLAETSTSAGTRADVWRQLSHVTDPSLLAPLLYSLRHDESARVREEAAETLADFLPDASARSALQYAADNDPDKAVRAQALESLHEGGG